MTRKQTMPIMNSDRYPLKSSARRPKTVLSLWLAAVCTVTAPLSASSSSLSFVNQKQARPLPSLVKPLPQKQAAAELLAYLRAHGEKLGITEPLDGLQLTYMKSSLLGDHFYFQRQQNGIPVFGEQLVVSVNRASGAVNKIYNQLSNRLFNVKEYVKRPSAQSQQQALARSWQFFQPQGKLLSEPQSELVYVPRGQQLRLAFQNTLELSDPRGSWRQLIDVDTGEILKTWRLDVPHKANAESSEAGGKIRSFPINKQLKPFAEALAQFKQEQPTPLDHKSAMMAEGSGLVFDPDPRTALNDESLEQSSPGVEFEPAYQSVTLRDITFDGTEYSLTGPWVRIIDFDAPATRPTTTPDGQWRGKRGEPEFYDVMSYFHLDQNQRYIQSLGFTGATGIQQTSIEVDADGAQGADNSYFLPASNRLAFGHGGVPDNEDADVILHEYGHAIHFGINPSWGGGDTGAIGEGFGDYWAGSYSYSTPNGQSFNPHWVYTWDGHNAFWAGRVMNRTDYRYDPDVTYTAHMTIDNRPDYGDELWSTPLFQSLVQLTDAGRTREEVDTIVLEGQFGLGANIRMPDMARSIVSAAAQLFPDGPHATVFYQNFRLMNILNQDLQVEPIEVVSSGDDTTVEPLELVNLKIPLSNISALPVSNLQASVTTASNDVTVVTGSGSYANMAAAETATNIEDFVLAVGDDASCGSTIDLSLSVSYQIDTTPPTTASDNFPLQLQVGDLVVETDTNTTPVAIPDNDSNGITSTIEITGATTTIGAGLNIDIDLEHPFVGDLIITLTSPQGTRVVLFDPDDLDSGSNVQGNFPADYQPVDSLSAFIGEDPNGTWTLTVSDNAAEDQGTLNSWSINRVMSGNCVERGLQPQTLVIEEAGSDGIVQRGETVSIKVPMLNNSSYAADAIVATLSTATTGVTVLADEASYPNIDPQQTRSNTDNFRFTVDPSVACGTELSFVLNYQYRLDENDALAASDTHEFGLTLPANSCDADQPDSNEDVKELLYALALIILVGVNAGSMPLATLMLLLLLVRRRHL
jgi:subtilisin-like proprotein convertase family protein